MADIQNTDRQKFVQLSNEYGDTVSSVEKFTQAELDSGSFLLPGFLKGDENEGTYDKWGVASFADLRKPMTDAAAELGDIKTEWEGADGNGGIKKEVADATASATTAAAAATTAAGNVQTAIDNANTAAGSANTAASNANDKAALANTAAGNANSATSAANTAASNANDKAALAQTATTNANTATGNANTATTNANNAADAANTAAASVQTAIDAAEAATAEASNVNAQLSGMTVTITNRQGQASSVNIGFEIYRTYTSVAAMNADAANVPNGKFVIIATTDPTSADNAKLYTKNSQGGFTFLSDLDQASSAAWADWLNNMKPAIESATTAANTAASTATAQGNAAESKGNTAQSQGNTAESKGNAAETKGNFAKTQGDYAKAWNDHPPFIGDGTTGDLNYWYLYNVSTSQYVKGPYAKGDDLHWDDMSAAEKERLINEMLTYLEAHGFDTTPTSGSTKPVTSNGIYMALQGKQDTITFATIPTAEAVIDELV